MKTIERPILMNAWSINAIVGGRKTQTRRIITPQPPSWTWNRHKWEDACINVTLNDDRDYWVKCPYGQPGDRLWVRESWRFDIWGARPLYKITYRTDDSAAWVSCDRDLAVLRDTGYKSPIHMPREFSRFLLEIRDIRVERIQDISVQDIVAEGMLPKNPDDLAVIEAGLSNYDDAIIECFVELWDSINAGRDFSFGLWESNPWVWVIEFEVHNEADR